MSKTVYVVIIEDRHADTDVEVWQDKEAAISRARAFAQARCKHSEYYSEENIAEWLFFAKYSTEGDCTRVVERELQ